MLTGHDGWVPAVAVASQGKLLASAGWDGVVRLWELPGGKLQIPLPLEGEKIESVAFAPQSGALAAGTQSGLVALWQFPGNQGPQTLADFTHAVTSLAWSPDGKHLAVAQTSGAVQWWDVQQKKWLGQLDAHSSAVYGLAFSPDGHLATCGEDKIVRLWDVASIIAWLRQSSLLLDVKKISSTPDRSRFAAGPFRTRLLPVD